ncbi:hypothetical protein JMJ35_010526 [Cladonia borealis]|uniref:Uncharacterized protein n=1 Tax=Cladonia borealis TaxID=184061 RepID=A0AA39QST3_9LECA|nr:hypothetical protein JMJ35_010526 [Cladonia borealis]
MFQPNHNTVVGGNTSNAAQHMQHPQSGGPDSSTVQITNGNVSERSGQATQNLAQSQHSNLLSQRIQDLRHSHQPRNPPPQPTRPQAPRSLAGENPTLAGPDDYYHIPYNYDVLLDHNPNNPYRPPSPPAGPEVTSTSRPAQAHDLYWCLELNGEYSRQTLSTILRCRQPGYWRCEPEPGACAYFVRVSPFRAGETP